MDETDAGDEGFDDVDLLQGGDDQQLQVQLLEQLQAVLGRFVRAAPEGLVDDYEAEGARAHRAPFQTELIGQTGGKDGVGQLFLLAAGFAAGIGIMLVLHIVLAPTLAGGEQKAVAHVGDLGGPAPVLFAQALTAPEAIDDGLDLEELGLRVLRLFGAGQGALGADAQVALEVADLGVGTGLGLQADVTPGVVVDLGERGVDPFDALFDGLALAGELGVEIGDFVDSVDVEQFLEAGFEARQIVPVQLRQQGPVFVGGGGIGVEFGGLQLVGLLEFGHGLDDFLGEPFQSLLFGVDARFQPRAHILLTVVTGLDTELMFTQSLVAQGLNTLGEDFVRRTLVQQCLGLVTQGDERGVVHGLDAWRKPCWRPGEDSNLRPAA